MKKILRRVKVLKKIERWGASFNWRRDVEQHRKLIINAMNVERQIQEKLRHARAILDKMVTHIITLGGWSKTNKRFVGNWRKIKSPKNDRSLISFREFIHNALASFKRNAANKITANIKIDMNFDAPNSARMETTGNKNKKHPTGNRQKDDYEGSQKHECETVQVKSPATGK